MLTDHYLQTFFIWGKHYGSSVGKTEMHARGVFIPPQSLAYFCPECGEVWARVVVADRPFSIWTIPCERHPHFRSQPAGSLWLSWQPEFNNNLPPQVLAREVRIHIAHYDHWKGDII